MLGATESANSIRLLTLLTVYLAVWFVSLGAPGLKLAKPVTVCAPASKPTLGGSEAVKVGAWLTKLTVTSKVSLVERWPSLTVSVIVSVPVWKGAGVTITVRSAPLPPSTMPESGMSDWFEDDAVTVRFAVAPPTVNGRAWVLVFSSIVWLATGLMVGAVGVGVP